MDEYFYDFYDNNELYHHGIKGQKWGVRNGPPYPLGSGKDPKVFLAKYKNSPVGGLKEKWDSQTTNEKLITISIAATAITAVSTIVETGVNLYRKHKRDKIEEEREKRLQEREKRLQEQNKRNKSVGQMEKKLEEMSDSELQNEIKRMRLEEEYKRLNKSTESEASKFMKETGKQVAQQVIKSGVAILINKFGPKAIDSLMSSASDVKTNIKIRQEEKSEKPSKQELSKAAESIKEQSEKTNSKLRYQKLEENNSERAIKNLTKRISDESNRRSTLIQLLNRASSPEEEAEYNKKLDESTEYLKKLYTEREGREEELKKAKTHIY